VKGRKRKSRGEPSSSPFPHSTQFSVDKEGRKGEEKRRICLRVKKRKEGSAKTKTPDLILALPFLIANTRKGEKERKEKKK